MALVNVVEICKEDGRLHNTTVADFVSKEEGLRIAKSRAEANLRRMEKELEGRTKSDREWFQDEVWMENKTSHVPVEIWHKSRFELPHLVMGWRLDLV